MKEILFNGRPLRPVSSDLVSRIDPPIPLGWSVANQEETALLRVGWRMFLMAHERWPEKYPDNPKNIWVPTNAATFTFGDPGNVVLYEHEELAKQAAADSGGKVVPVSFGAAP